MKFHKNTFITASLLCLGLIVSLGLAWKVSEKMRYDEECASALCQPFESIQMGVPEQQFYDEAVSSWKVIAQMDTHEGLKEQCEDLGFTGNVSGLVDLFTASLPEYSFIDTKRNDRAMDIAGIRWMMAQARSHKSPTIPVLFYREGLVYFLYRDDLVQAYEDKDKDGEMRSAMYFRK